MNGQFWYLGVHGMKHSYQWEYEIEGVLFCSPTAEEAFSLIKKWRGGETL